MSWRKLINWAGAVAWVAWLGATAAQAQPWSQGAPAASVAIAQPLWLATAFNNNDDYKLWLLSSPDGIKWNYVGVDPILAYNSSNPTLRNSFWFVQNGTYYLCEPQTTTVNIYQSTNLATWTLYQTITCNASGMSTVWATYIFTDATNGLHLMSCQSPNGSTGFQPYEQHPTTAGNISSWSTPTALGGTWWANVIDAQYAYNAADGNYYCFYKQEGAASSAYIGVGMSASLTNGWNTTKSGDWAGWGAGYEGTMLINRGNGIWRLYLQNINTIGGLWYTETAAFPYGPWSTTNALSAPQTFSAPGIYYANNLGVVAQVAAAAQALNYSLQPYNMVHAPYADYVLGANLYRYPTTGLAGPIGWNALDAQDTNYWASQVNFYYGTGGAEFDFAALAPPGLAGGGWATYGKLNSSGWVGPTINLSGATPLTVISNSTIPGNTSTPRTWVQVTISGQTFYVPGYK